MENKENQNDNLTKKQYIMYFIIGFIVGLLVVGIAVYVILTKKPESNKPKDDNIQEQENHNSTPIPTTTPESNGSVESKDIVEEYFQQYEITKKVTYKSKDGKNELVIEPKSEDNYAYFNGKKFGAGVVKLGKYLLVEGYKLNTSSQCGDYNYIINTETNTLVDLYKKNLIDIIKLNDNYYFREYICGSGDVAIYDENLNKIGTDLIVVGTKYFYILDGNIVKYDSNGKIVFKSSEAYKLANKNDVTAMVDETGVYILIVSNGEIFFIDSNVEDLKPIKIGTTKEYNYYFGVEGVEFISPIEDGKIRIDLSDKQDKSLDITYDTKTKTISK